MLWAAGGAVAQPPAFGLVGSFATGQGSEPFSVAFSPSGGLLATADYSAGSVTVFKVDRLTGELSDPVSTEVGNGAVVSVAFSPSGRLLAAGNGRASVTVFRVDEQTGALGASPVTESVPGGGVYSVAFSPSGALLAAGNFTGSVTMFRVDEQTGALGASPVTESVPGGSVWSVAFSPGGGLLATASLYTGTVTVFKVDEQTGGLTEVTTRAPGGNMYEAAFSPSGRLLATGSGSPSQSVTVFKVDEPTGDLTAVATTPVTRGAVYGVRFSPSGGLLATANSNGSATVFRVDGQTGALSDEATEMGLPGSPFKVAFSPNGRFFATANLDAGSVSVLAGESPLVIDKAARAESGVAAGVVRSGGEVSYTVTIHNPTGFPVGGPVIDDLSGVLDHASLISGPTLTPDIGKVSHTGHEVVWDGTLGPEQTVVVHYRVHVGALTREVVLVDRVTGPDGFSCAGDDPAVPCLTQTAAAPHDTPGAPNLVLTKTVSPTTAHPGGQVTYTLVVRNDGPGEATAVRLTDPGPPAGVFFQEARTHDGTCAISATGLSCELSPVPGHGSAQVLVTATVRTDAAGRIENLAVVSARQGDSDWASNTARAALHITPPPPTTDPGVQPVSDLVLTKHVDHHTVRRGGKLRYTITITNHGPHDAAGVRLTDTARLPLQVRSIHSAQGHCSPGAPPIVCTLGSLPGGAHTTVTITALATVAGAQRNTASVTSDSWDPNPATSLASARTTVTTGAPPAVSPPSPPFTG